MKFDLLHLALGLTSLLGVVQSKMMADNEYIEKPLNIVLHSAFGGRSHIKGMLEIGEELYRRGHKLTLVAPEDFIRFTKGYHIGNHTISEPLTQEELIRKFMKENVLKKTNENTFKVISNTLGEIILHGHRTIYPPLKQYLIENKPDLIHCDFFAHACSDLAKELGIPLIIGFQSTDQFGIIDKPYTTIGFDYAPMTTLDLSFSQRFYYKVIDHISNWRYFGRIINEENKQRQKNGIPSSDSLVGDLNYGLGIANTFMGLEPSLDLYPNLFQVGPIITENKDTLSTELEEFLNNNERTLFIGFGSQVVLNQEITMKVLEAALLAIEQGVADALVWGLGRTKQDDFPIKINNGKGEYINVKDLFDGKHPKVKLLSWAPQVAILNHENTKLFLSHGGLESLFEAVLSGTPVACLALTGDQPRNARKVVEMGTGVYVDKFEFTPKSLKEQFRLILEDKDNMFKANLQRMKTISRYSSRRLNFAADLWEQHAYTAKACRPFEPYNVNSILPPCELKHLRPVSNQMSIIKANNIDIYAFALLLIVISALGLGVTSYLVTNKLLDVRRKAGTKNKSE